MVMEFIRLYLPLCTYIYDYNENDTISNKL